MAIAPDRAVGGSITEGGLERWVIWDERGALAEALTGIGRSRVIALTVPDAQSALAIVSRTDVAALAPREARDPLRPTVRPGTAGAALQFAHDRHRGALATRPRPVARDRLVVVEGLGIGGGSIMSLATPPDGLAAGAAGAGCDLEHRLELTVSSLLAFDHRRIAALVVHVA